MKAIVERHGGSVEKFIGDGVMAVFGVPVVHEDGRLGAGAAHRTAETGQTEWKTRWRGRWSVTSARERYGAGDGDRTRYLNLGKVALCQMSYSR
jgi:class 3 adenylate cyclase